MSVKRLALDLLERVIPQRSTRPPGAKPKAAHICALDRNVGDNALNLAIRQMLGDRLDIAHFEILRTQYSNQPLRELRTCDLIILGGGGLIHSYGPRGNPLTDTGTLWRIPLQNLKSLKQPI